MAGQGISIDDLKSDHEYRELYEKACLKEMRPLVGD